MQTTSADSFFLGLLAASYYNFGDVTQARRYADFLARQQSPDGSIRQISNFFTPDEARRDRYLEATAIAAIAW
jgi:hypothetical protein